MRHAIPSEPPCRNALNAAVQVPFQSHQSRVFRSYSTMPRLLQSKIEVFIRRLEGVDVFLFLFLGLDVVLPLDSLLQTK